MIRAGNQRKGDVPLVDGTFTVTDGLVGTLSIPHDRWPEAIDLPPTQVLVRGMLQVAQTLANA